MSYLPSSLAILGSTGSIGTQALDVVRTQGLSVGLLTGGSNEVELERQAREFLPPLCVMADEKAASGLRIRLSDTKVKVTGGSTAICDALSQCGCDAVLNAIVGEAGLLPTLTALSTTKRLALANKESLVVGGELVMAKAKKEKCELIPVDSEHSAIYQCLRSNRRRDVRSILLTASGGPFYGKTKEQLSHVTKTDALAHPTWKMGAKITVDSATMMNKGFEVIEAVRLFGIPAKDIRVMVHRQSILHSAVEYIDNALIAQLGSPDMRTCISYALSAPSRLCGISRPLDLCSVGALTFTEPDNEVFPLLSAAKDAVTLGGATPAVLNAANEEAVAAFLSEKLSFVGISETVMKTVSHFAEEACHCHTLESILFFSREARDFVRQKI